MPGACVKGAGGQLGEDFRRSGRAVVVWEAAFEAGRGGCVAGERLGNEPSRGGRGETGGEWEEGERGVAGSEQSREFHARKDRG